MAEELRYTVKADGADEAAKDLDKLADAAKRVEGTTVDVSATVHTERASAELDALSDEAKTLDRATVDVSATADTDKATAELKEFEREARRLDGQTASVDVKVDTTRAEQAIRRVDEDFRDLSAKDRAAVLRLEAKQFQREIARAQRDLIDLDNDEATARVSVIDNARANLDRIEAKLREIDGKTVDARVDVDTTQATSRLTAFGAQARRLIGSYWQEAVAGAGLAIAGFTAKAIGDFQTLALEADKFATSSGQSLEEASRWIEVGDDLGVSAETMAGAFQRMNRAAEKGVLADLGIDANDASERFQNVLRYLRDIDDETIRAAEAQKILGRGWQEIAPLVSEVDSLNQALANVSGKKVIDEEEVRKAREFRDTMDKFRDAVDDLSLKIGGVLVPVVNDLGEAIGALPDFPELPDWAGWFQSPISLAGKLRGALDGLWEVVAGGGESMRDLSEAFLEHESSELGAERAAKRHEDQLRRSITTTEEAEEAWREFRETQDRTPGAYERVGRALEEHRARLRDLTEWTDRYRESVRDAARDEKVWQASIVERNEALREGRDLLTSGLDAELALEEARAARAEATQRGGEAFGAAQTGEGTQAEFEAAFRDEQRAILRAAEARGELARFQGADEAGVTQAMLDELSRLMGEVPAQSAFIDRLMGMLRQQIAPAAAPPLPPQLTERDLASLAARKTPAATTPVVIVTGADPQAVITAAQTAWRQGGYSGIR